MTRWRFPAARRCATLFKRCRRGATAVEYALILALIVLAMLATLQSLAGVTIRMWGKISNSTETHL